MATRQNTKAAVDDDVEKKRCANLEADNGVASTCADAHGLTVCFQLLDFLFSARACASEHRKSARRNWLQHECEPKTCKFDAVDHFWLCRETGCVHECAAGKCDYSEKTPDGQFCSISGYNYEEFSSFEPVHADDDDANVAFYPYRGEGLAVPDMPGAKLLESMMKVERANERKRKRIADPVPKRHVVRRKPAKIQSVQFSDGDLQQFKAVCKAMLLHSLVSELPEATVTQIVEATGQFQFVQFPLFQKTTMLTFFCSALLVCV